MGGLILPTLRAAPAESADARLVVIGARGFVQLFASDLDQMDADHLDFKLGADGRLSRSTTRTANDPGSGEFGAQTTDVPRAGFQTAVAIFSSSSWVRARPERPIMPRLRT